MTVERVSVVEETVDKMSEGERTVDEMASCSTEGFICIPLNMFV